MTKKYPSLYQINTRVWLNQFGPDFQISDIPDSYWDYLAKSGIDYIWLMGVWQLADQKVAHWDLHPKRINDYSHEVGYQVSEDIIDGSPYAIDLYSPSDNNGNFTQFQQLKVSLHARGMKLMLDYVPNHFSAGTSWLDTHPEYFIQGNLTDLAQKPEFYFQHEAGIFAHGKDPYFGAWRDTVQIDYFNPEARIWMANELKNIAEICDGVRCDMAMLLINNVFTNTWQSAYHGPADLREVPEFWPGVIQEIKQNHPDFTLLAEVYWDMEWDLQMMGFDYTYDKRLLDRLKDSDNQGIKEHLKADISFQSKSVRFIENHDEKRALKIFSIDQSRAAAVTTYTLPGMRFFHDGQWEGRMRRLPVQLIRFPEEIPCACPIRDKRETIHPTPIFCECTHRFYQKLKQIIHLETFTMGNWEFLDINHDHLFSWQWSLNRHRFIVLINYSNGYIEKIDINLSGDRNHTGYDVLNDEQLTLDDGRLLIGFRPFQSRIIEIMKN